MRGLTKALWSAGALSIALSVAMADIASAQLRSEVPVEPAKRPPGKTATPPRKRARTPAPAPAPPPRRVATPPVRRSPPPVMAPPERRPSTDRSVVILDEAGSGDAVTLASAIAITGAGGEIRIKAGSYRFSGVLPRGISLVGIPKPVVGSNGRSSDAMPVVYSEDPKQATLWVTEGSHRIQNLYVWARGSGSVALEVRGGSVMMSRGGLGWTGPRGTASDDHGRALYVEGGASFSAVNTDIGPGQQDVIFTRGSLSVDGGVIRDAGDTFAAIGGKNSARIRIRNVVFKNTLALLLGDAAGGEFSQNTVLNHGDLAIIDHRSTAALTVTANVFCLERANLDRVIVTEAGSGFITQSGNIITDGTSVENPSAARKMNAYNRCAP